MVEADARRNIPPLKPDQYNRFDSVTSTDSNYVTLYDSYKQFPAYVVSFR